MISGEGKDGTNDPPPKRARVRLLSVLLENRSLGWWMLGGGLTYFALSLIGIYIFSCPIRNLTGLQCPGCGLTSGSKALIRGDWDVALQSNLFTPIIALFWAAVAIGLVLPQPARGKFLHWAQQSERVTHWPAILGISLLIYTLTRNIMPS